MNATGMARKQQSASVLAPQYDHLPRHVKLRLLLSTILIETPDDGASAVLDKALKDERWVSLIAELVQARTASSGHGQERATSSMLADVADTVVKQVLLDANADTQQQPHLHFEPTDLKFVVFGLGEATGRAGERVVPSAGSSAQQVQANFSYAAGARPDFMRIELEP